MFSIYELRHSLIEKCDGQFWIVRDKETEIEYGDRIMCKAFTRAEDESHEDILEKGYIHYGNQDGIAFYLIENTPKSA